MFTEEQIKAYRNIKAPNELRFKIAGTKKSNKKPFYYISAAVACFVLIISIANFNNQSGIIVNGQKLTDEIVFYDTSTASVRVVSSAISVPVEIKATKDTKISVLQGFVINGDGERSKEVNISSSQIIWWEIEPNETQNVFEMIISDKNGADKVTLKYENAKITATREKEK